MEVTTPYPDSPDKGTFMTTAELHPMASEQYVLVNRELNLLNLEEL
jgi:exosome complex RNA-binding protein Rrp42 (RNase PH superfamily)